MEKKLIIEAKNVIPSRPRFRVIGVFNPAVVRVGAGYVMLARVAEAVVQDDPDHFLVPVLSATGGMEIVRLPKDDPDYDYCDPRLIRNHRQSYLTSISHLRVARSRDGEHFAFDAAGIVQPDGIYERYGIEDARVTKIGSTFFVTYTAVSDCGINVRLMATTDFVDFRRIGNIFHSDNKDCVIFPKRIHGKYFALHRPSLSHFGKLDVWTAESPNLVDWGNHKVMTEARVGYAPSVRVGAGAVPLLTPRGWLEVYHSADASDRYHLTAMLLDRKDPNRVLMKGARPLLEPTEPYERDGFVKNVVFTCGVTLEDDVLSIYYGVCDENVALCRMTVAEAVATMAEV
ncbi:MAG: glycoside hydrolase family 130 protein [Candidatus Izemoplasmatales bacterium]